MRRYRRKPQPRCGARGRVAAARRRSTRWSARTGFRRSAFRNSAARLHHRGDRSRRRGRPAGDRCPQRADLRFMPACRMGGNFNEDMPMRLWPVGPLPPMSRSRGAPRPPASIPSVQAARRCRCRRPRRRIPRTKPRRAARPSRRRTDAAIGGGAGKAGDAPPPPAATTSAVEAKPAAPRFGRPRKCRRCRGWIRHLPSFDPRKRGRRKI